jgi:hypothetical protein
LDEQRSAGEKEFAAEAAAASREGEAVEASPNEDREDAARARKE